MVAERPRLTAPPAEPRAAADYYDALARDADPPRRAALRIQAAQALLAAGDTAGARARLTAIDVTDLDDALILRRQAVLARVLLAEGQPDAAVAALDALDTLSGAPADDRARALTVRAQARAARGDAIGAIRDRALAAPALRDAAEIANRDALIELLRGVPRARLAEALADAGPGIHGSWLELGLALQDDPATRAASLARWQDRYPGHPARAALAGRPAPAGAPLAPAPPGLVPVGPITGTVVVLLPLSSELEAVARAAQDGLLAAWYAAPEPRPELRFADTGNGSVGAAYDAAVAQGAQAIIGPLRKEAVAELAARGTLPVPTLALNAPDSGVLAGNLFVLSLDPLDEVLAAQAHAWNRGLRRAAILYPTDPWGERLFELMRDAWVARGGTVRAVQGYPPGARDPGAAVAAVLGIAAGAQRHRRLEQLLGTPLGYQPGPAQDVDVLLLAATAAQARLVEPQVRYHGATDLPVYATAQAWDLASPPGLNRDLEGLAFCDTPYSLGTAPVRVDLPPAGGLARVQALGHDAYLALTGLSALAGGGSIAGLSGTLHDAGGGRIGRQLPCARFTAGTPRLLDGGAGPATLAGPP